jgi:hypothetical protein
LLEKHARWGENEAETAWLRSAGFTRRNTRRAILRLLRELLLPGERIAVITTGTYRFQMGYLAVTDRRALVGMSWAFIPFVSKHLAMPLEQVRLARHEHRPWGAKVEVFSHDAKFSFGDLEDDEAERLAALIGGGIRPAPVIGSAPETSQGKATTVHEHP